MNTPIHIVDPETDSDFEVTLFDSNHIMGSVMFLFKTKDATALHTGDFRFHKKFYREMPLLYPMEKYLDKLKF